MFLETLEVRNIHGTIRLINFRQGLNLVLDNRTADSVKTGNSVGKTTLLRLVDFCLGSDGKDIYVDPEFKQENKLIKDFLYGTNVNCTLNLRTRDDRSVVIWREFANENEVWKLNGDTFEKEGPFLSALKETMFDGSSNKPTFRQLIPKFLRSNVHRMTNAVKYLHPQTNLAVYELLWLYLFGFPQPSLLEERLRLRNSLDKTNKRIKELENPHDESALVQLIAVVEDEIAEVKSKLSGFRLTDTFSRDSEELEQLGQKIAALLQRKASIELSLQLERDSVSSLKEGLAEVDVDFIESMYKEVKHFIPELHRSFAEAIDFHNGLIGRKIEFIEGNIPRIETKLKSTLEEIDSLKASENIILSKFEDSETFDRITEINGELNRLHERRGGYKGLLDQLRIALEERANLKESFDAVDITIATFEEKLEARLQSYNKHFSALSRALWGTSYLVSISGENRKGVREFRVMNAEANMGSGKKKALVAAFDLAYSEMLRSERGFRAPNFVMHDSLEDVHQNQLRQIFQVAEEREIQYVVSLLREKVSYFDDEFLEQHAILQLDEGNKFFKL